MLKNPTIHEFEAKATMRVTLHKLANPLVFSYAEALSNVVYACNDLLKELGINRELWVRVRGNRAFMFHEDTHRIVAEVGVISDELPNGKRHRLRVELFGKGGQAIKDPTIGDLAVYAAKLGKFQNRPRVTNFRPKEVVHHG